MRTEHMSKAGAGRRAASWAAGLLLTASLSGEAAEATVFPKSGDPYTTKSIRFIKSSQEYVVDKEGVVMRVPVNSVKEVRVVKPAAMDQAARMISQGQQEAAVTLLKQVASEYAMLQWDVQAQKMLAELYTKMGNNVEAEKLYSSVLREQPADQVPVEMRKRKWEMMLAAQKFEALGSELGDAISKGNRETAAAAQMMRANVSKAQNKTLDALLDYLRTALLFEEVTSQQPEALFRAAEMMDALRDPRATEIRKRLTAKYPNSEWARKLESNR